MEAKDGKIGKAHDLFFDDAQWGVRYLVVDAGSWLPGRRVLISPASLGQADWMKRVFPIELTKEEIENSPGVACDKPVARQLEKEVADYFSWPVYWNPAAVLAGSVASVNPPPPTVPQTGKEDTTEAPAERQGDPHLRSAREVAGYHIQAQDGEIGHVEDFIVDDEAWIIRYVVVDTRNWLPGRRVLLAPDWFVSFDWHESMARTGVSKGAIQDAPACDHSQPINRDYEGRLYGYYGRPAYWTQVPAPSLSWRI
jgi:hypothetical protein